MLKTREELENSLELCNYCPLEKQYRGANCYGGEPILCCDLNNYNELCDKAYENYCDYSDDYNE